MWIYLAFASVLLIFLYKKWTSPYTFWKNRNIDHPEINLLFGNMKEPILMKKSMSEVIKDYCREYKNLPYFGFYKARTPAIIINNPEILKLILVKEFSSFHDNDVVIDEKADPLFSKNPFVVKGPRWKHVRTQITPCFTSGKMKAIFPIMQKITKKFLRNIEEILQKEAIEFKQLCGKFTIENVVCCAFGVDANVFEDPDSVFLTIANDITNPSTWTAIKTILTLLVPEFANFLSMVVIPPKATYYLRKLTEDIPKYRQESNIKRNDFLDNLLEIQAKDPTLKHDDLASHCAGLFLDGYETSTTALSFIMYNLAKNTDAQIKLQQEVDEVSARGNDNYETILNLPYLDACINESLRLYPAIGVLFKKCTRDITISPPEGSENVPPVKITTDVSVVIPTLALHRDGRYFSEPEKYKPERFINEEIIKYTFMPFGEGPRTCLGQRFALMQIKVLIFYFVAEFELKVNKKTIEPIILDPKFFLSVAKGGLWLDYQKRKK